MFEYNKIYNVDSYKAIKEIPDKSIDLIYTDIPYLLEGNGGGSSRVANAINKMDEELTDIKNGIDYSILDEFVRIQPHIYIYIWCSKLQILDLLNYFVTEHKCRFEILTWHKTNPIPSCNGKWLSDTEYCLVFKEAGTPKYNDGYENKFKYYVSSINAKDKKMYGHPTIKPLELVERHLKHSCKKDMVVFDPFVGSGTTAVACKELGINYLGFELNKEYYEIAVNRLNGQTKAETEIKNKQLSMEF